MTTPEVRARGTRLPKTARRSQLLGAAREVFVAQGYHAAAMDEIAERAGVSKPVLYQHFPGKHELYLALVDQHAKEIVEAVRAALASTKDNKLRGALAIAAFFDFIDGEGESFRLIFESDLTNDPAVQQRVNWVHEECADAIAEIIAEETGLPSDESELIGIALGGMAHTAARYWFRAGRRIPREEAIRMVAQLVWRGIAGFPRVNESQDADIAALPLPASRSAAASEAIATPLESMGAPLEVAPTLEAVAAPSDGGGRAVPDVTRHDSVAEVRRG